MIADEPTTALDVTIQAQILTLLKDLQARLDMALLLITHDLGIVRKVADRVCVMHEGRIVEAAHTDQLFAEPAHAYTKTLLTAQPKGNPVPAPVDAKPVLEVDKLSVHYAISRGFLARKDVLRAVDAVSITVKAGHTTGVVGESGSGKTTLGMAVLRLTQSKGDITFAGKPLQGLGNKALKPYRSRMQIVFQDPYGSLSPRRSVQQIIEQGLRVHQPQLDEAALAALVDEALRDVGLDPADKDRMNFPVASASA